MVTVFPEGFPGILCTTVSAEAVDPKPEGRHHLLYEKRNGVDCFPHGLDEVDSLYVVNSSVLLLMYFKPPIAGGEMGPIASAWTS